MSVLAARILFGLAVAIFVAFGAVGPESLFIEGEPVKLCPNKGEWPDPYCADSGESGTEQELPEMNGSYLLTSHDD